RVLDLVVERDPADFDPHRDRGVRCPAADRRLRAAARRDHEHERDRPVRGRVGAVPRPGRRGGSRPPRAGLRAVPVGAHRDRRRGRARRVAAPSRGGPDPGRRATRVPRADPRRRPAGRHDAHDAQRAVRSHLQSVDRAARGRDVEGEEGDMSLFEVKDIDAMRADAAGEGSGLRRVLGTKQLVFLGIGAVIGAGIFSTLGDAAAGSADRAGAGPAVVLSFLLLGGVCALAGLCYAEMAAMLPAAGSAYTYSYLTLGRLAAWIVGWNLILEYAIGNVGVAISWSSYLQGVLGAFGVTLPGWLG